MIVIERAPFYFIVLAVFSDLIVLARDRVIGKMDGLADIGRLSHHRGRIDVDFRNLLFDPVAKRQRLLEPLTRVFIIPTTIDKAIDLYEGLIDHEIIAYAVDFGRKETLSDCAVCITVLVKVFERIPMIERHGRQHVLNENRRAILNRLQATIIDDVVERDSVHRNATELSVVGLDYHVAETVKLSPIEDFDKGNFPAGILQNTRKLCIEISVVAGNKRRHPWGLLQVRKQRRQRLIDILVNEAYTNERLIFLEKTRRTHPVNVSLI